MHRVLIQLTMDNGRMARFIGDSGMAALSNNIQKMKNRPWSTTSSHACGWLLVSNGFVKGQIKVSSLPFLFVAQARPDAAMPYPFRGHSKNIREYEVVGRLHPLLIAQTIIHNAAHPGQE